MLCLCGIWKSTQFSARFYCMVPSALFPCPSFEHFHVLLCYVLWFSSCSFSLSLSSVIRLSFSLTFGGHKLRHPTVPGGQYQGTRPICRSIISLCNHSVHHEQLQLATVCVSVCVAALTLFQNCLKITINQGYNFGCYMNIM